MPAFRGNLSVPFSGSSSPRHVLGKPIRLIFRVKQSNRRFGTTYPSHFQCQAVQETFRVYISVPFSVSSSPTDVSGLPIRPIFRVQQYKKRFGRTYPSHFVSISKTDVSGQPSIQFSGSSSPRNVSGNPSHFRVKQSNRRFGKTYPSHFRVKRPKGRFGINISILF